MTANGARPPIHQRVTSRERERTFGLELCRRHAEALARMASLILDDDVADEVVSDTIAAASRFAGQPASREITRTLLARSVYHRCLGHLATRERFAPPRRYLGPDDAYRPGTSGTMPTTTQRATLALVLFGDCDLAQAATTLNLSPGAVTGHLRDALATICAKR